VVVDQPVNNIALGLFHAQALQMLRQPNPQANLDAKLSADMGGTVRGEFVPGDVLNLAYYVGGNSSRLIFYIDGIGNDLQAADIIAGYSDTSVLLRPSQGTTNTFFLRQADRILSKLNTFRTVPEFVDFVGYSAGGATALVLRSSVALAGSLAKMKIFTYGSPRSFGGAGRDAADRAAIVRYMTPDDPIPLVPLDVGDNPHLATFVPAPVLMAWATFAHTQGGMQINGDGTTEARALPVNAAAFPVSSVVSWLWSQENDSANAHAIARYVAYLSVGVTTRPAPAQQLGGLGGGEDFDVPARRQVNRERARVETAIQTQGRQQNIVEEVVPDAQLFKAVRIGRVWWVAFGDRLIVAAPIKKRARHLARAGNDFLRSLPKQAVVDPQGLSDQLTAFLQAAADPASGFVPTINSNFPT